MEREVVLSSASVGSAIPRVQRAETLLVGGLDWKLVDSESCVVVASLVRRSIDWSDALPAGRRNSALRLSYLSINR